VAKAVHRCVLRKKWDGTTLALAVAERSIRIAMVVKGKKIHLKFFSNLAKSNTSRKL
jgi:hypothetical protein